MLTFALALPLLFVAGDVKSDTFTGCLNDNGNLNKIAAGPAPSSPCTGNSQQVSWNAQGPQGEQGEQGPPGDDAFFDTTGCSSGDVVTFTGSILECVTPAVPSVRTVFLTSASFPGNLSNDLGCPNGLAGGDCICETLAFNAGLGMNFKAWLSTSVDEPAGPNFYHHDGPYVRIDGAMIATSWDDLTDGTLLHPIEVDEQGGRPSPLSILIPAHAWTNTHPSGEAVFTVVPPGLMSNCADWTTNDNSVVGRAGFITSTDFLWSNANGRRCDRAIPLYCFEQQ
jgi:hypothetical protein